jgi:hypothetical protein
VIPPLTDTGASLLTKNTLCGSFTGKVAQCSTVTINCAAAITSDFITVQLYTNGQNVHLMFEDLTYSTAAVTTRATGNYSYNVSKFTCLNKATLKMSYCFYFIIKLHPHLSTIIVTEISLPIGGQHLLLIV